MILLLTLDTFSRTGGIQQFNRCLWKALSEADPDAVHFSLWDRTSDVDSFYGNARRFRGFGRNRAALLMALLAGRGHWHTIILGHVNLLPLARLLGPGRCILVTHGIEVWQPLPAPRQSLLNRLKAVWSVSRYTGEQLVKLQGLNRDKLRILPNCIDPRYANATAIPRGDWNRHWRLDPSKRYLLTLTRLAHTEQAKGYDRVLNVMHQLQADILYLLAGKHDDAEYARLQQRISGLGLQGRVAMPGLVPAGHLPALYAGAAAFVLPSEKEGFGIVFLEAAWQGCPVVAVRTGGAPEALDGYDRTVWIEPGYGDDELAAALRQALEYAPLDEAQLAGQRARLDATVGFGVFAGRVTALISNSEKIS